MELIPISFLAGILTILAPCILPLLPVDALYYIAAPAIQRGLDPLVFIEQAKRYNLFCNHYESVNEAFKAAKKQAKKEDLVFIGGSNFVVAEVV